MYIVIKENPFDSQFYIYPIAPKCPTLPYQKFLRPCLRRCPPSCPNLTSTKQIISPPKCQTPPLPQRPVPPFECPVLLLRPSVVASACVGGPPPPPGRPRPRPTTSTVSRRRPCTTPSWPGPRPDLRESRSSDSTWAGVHRSPAAVSRAQSRRAL